MSLEDFKVARVIGLVGAVIAVLGGLIFGFGVIGLILILASLYYFSRFHGEDRIFKYALYATILAIVAAIFAGIAFFSFLAAITTGEESLGAWIASAIYIVLEIISGYFMYKSLGILAGKSGEKMFGVAGTLILIGVILEVILIGFFIKFVGLIILAVAFFTVKPLRMQQPIEIAASDIPVTTGT